MINKVLVVGLILLLLPLGLSVYYSPLDSVVIRARLHSQEQAVDGIANISISYPDDTQHIINASMSAGDFLGSFVYEYTFADGVIGDYLVHVDFYNATDLSYYGSAEDIYQVRINTNQQILDELTGDSVLPEPTDTKIRYLCPSMRQIDENFTVWLDYEYVINDTNIINATVTLEDSIGNYTLSFNPKYSRYENTFTSAVPIVWNYTITANASDLQNWTLDCTTSITSSLGLSVRLWQEVTTEAYSYNGNYIVQQKNYDKDFDEPYINDFAYILARNNDLNASGEYDYCQMPVGSVSSLMNTINFGGWMDEDNLTKTVVDLLGADDYVGCDKYWYSAIYQDGEASLAIPQSGNYSLYLLEGPLEWENEVSPPRIIKSGLFLPLGTIVIPTNQSYEADYYVTHAELDSWGTLTDSFFVILLILVPFILMILLITTDLINTRIALTLSIGWILLMTIIRML